MSFLCDGRLTGQTSQFNWNGGTASSSHCSLYWPQAVLTRALPDSLGPSWVKLCVKVTGSQWFGGKHSEHVNFDECAQYRLVCQCICRYSGTWLHVQRLTPRHFALFKKSFSIHKVGPKGIVHVPLFCFVLFWVVFFFCGNTEFVNIHVLSFEGGQLGAVCDNTHGHTSPSRSFCPLSSYRRRSLRFRAALPLSPLPSALIRAVDWRVCGQ